jgi:redox-sensitive bicupin YhaK (pirin superfamily)
MNAGDDIEHMLARGRTGYVHVVRGRVRVNDQVLHGGDALKLSGEPAIMLTGADNAELLVFDLPY